ncbi:hypothetical protein [Actinokineospora inagensis]|uniref:hypothetical protein n=1 Tax=Actinokineospora inagensis TaxID=103730 RepID=UPI00040A61A5|nr:hypothetical protein [Actinokineospora inagensis]
MTTASATTATAPNTRGLTAAVVLLAGALCTLVGLTWDVQWHSDVGPDTFFTLPHLFLYAGSAISGFASLAAVLVTTAARRAGKEVDPTLGGVPVGVFGRVFTAPLGYLVAGCGAASFLLYGLWDQWWHGLYGFDAVIDSPPHIGLLLSVAVTLVGTVIVFAAARDQLWGRVGVFTSLAALAAFTTVIALAFASVPARTVIAVHVAMAFLVVLCAFTGAAAVRKGGIGVALGLVVVQALTWVFTPWATRAYANAAGLPIRDYITGVPAMPALLPMCLILVTALVYPLTTIRAKWMPPVAGAVSAAVVAGLQSVQNAIVYDVHVPTLGRLLPTVAVAAAVGLLAGHLGWRFGHMLRLSSTARPEGA